MSRSLIVLPDDSVRPILDAINGAEKSIRVKMFVFSDPDLVNAVIAARKRGVNVRVMLNAARRSGESDNDATKDLLSKAGVEVNESNPAFDVTHEKSMVIDDKTAWVKSLNWATKNFTETRDYAIRTGHSHEVAEIVSCFEADWNREEFDPGEHAHLIWCRFNGRERIADFIDRAIIERIVRAKERGVKVHVMARPPHTLAKEKLVEGVGGLRIMDDVGVKVHKLKHLKLHAKLLFSDGLRAIVGSINLAPGSFDSRRELAIEVDDDDIVDRLHKVVQHDWETSHPLDLSDEGLAKEIGERAGVPD